MTRMLGAVALLTAACGAAGPFESRPAGLDRARTTVRPAKERCHAETAESTPIALLVSPGDEWSRIGNVLATRIGADADRACLWAEDGAAHGARTIGAEAIEIVRRRPSRDGSRFTCDVEARALRRRREDPTPDRPCSAQTFEGLDEQGELRDSTAPR